MKDLRSPDSQTLQGRYFNRLEVIGDRRIKKSSSKPDVFLDEVAWYRDLPLSLQAFVPKIYELSCMEGDAFIDMEWVRASSLSQLLLRADQRPEQWSNLCAHIEIFLGAFQDRYNQQAKPGTRESFLRDCREIYVDKTAARCAQYIDLPAFARFRSKDLMIQGKRCPGLDSALECLPKVWALLEASATPTFVHGDLCFGNVLYDSVLDRIFLVDPRGRFGSQTLRGDLNYEFAKLYQCIRWDYDFIDQGLFSCEPSDRGYFAEISKSKEQERTQRELQDWILRKSGLSPLVLDLMAALLFLSMIPLHHDKPRHQAAFVVRGLSILNMYGLLG